MASPIAKKLQCINYKYSILIHETFNIDENIKLKKFQDEFIKITAYTTCYSWYDRTFLQPNLITPSCNQILLSHRYLPLQKHYYFLQKR